MKVYGHGTTTGVGHEINSRESFTELAAGRPQVDGVELDVRRTADDQLVVIHDDCYPDGRLVVETAGEDRPREVLMLGDALDLCAGLEVNIELKNHPSEATFDPDERIAVLCAALLDERDHLDDVLVSCFGLGCLDRLAEVRPQTPTALLLLSRRPAEEILDAEVSRRHRVVHPFVSMVDEAFMQRCRHLGLRVNVWGTADESDEQMQSLIDTGVDGFITEAPGRMLLLRDR